jgi:hypothetical protein
MSKATIGRRKGVTVVVLLLFSLLLLPILAVSSRGFDLNNFAAMAQGEEASS